MSLKKTNSQHLYLFQHVPKCAGTTIINCIEDEIKHKSLNLEQKYQHKDQVWGHLVRQNLNCDGVVSIHGHRVFYGLHNISNREYRYYTFLRNPVTRVISLYNFWAGCKQREDIMFRNGELISFREFLKTGYVTNNMIRFLYHAQEGDLTPGSQIDNCSELHLNAAKKFLEQCWFIGFVESFEKDFGYVCSSMGISYRKERQRVSCKHFELSQDPGVKDLILELNQFDMALFEYAQQLRSQSIEYSIAN